MEVVTSEDIADQPAIVQEKQASRINWYSLLGLKLVLSSAAAMCGALAFLLFGE